MAYTITITFPAEYLNATDYIQLILTLTSSAGGSNLSYTSTEKNMLVLDYGKTEINYDVESARLTTGRLNLQLSDLDDYLHDLVFDDSYISKKFKAELKLNGSTEFIGYSIEDLIFCDMGDKSFEVTFAPRIEEIKKVMTYDFDGNNELDPHSYGGVHRSIQTMIENIFKEVDSGISTNIKQSWTFKGYKNGTVKNITGAVCVGGEVTVTSTEHGFVVSDQIEILNVGGMTDINDIWTITEKDDNTFTFSCDTSQTYTSGGTAAITKIDFAFTDLYLDADRYYENHPDLKNDGDVLKRMAWEFFAYAGIMGENSAFFKELFYYSGGEDLQTLGSVENVIKNYKIGLVDFVRIKTEEAVIQTYEYGEETSIEDRYIVDTYPRMFLIQHSQTECTAYVDEDLYYINGVKNTDYEDWLAHGDLLAKMWYLFRGDITRCRVDKFENVAGVDYDFLKNFQYNSKSYHVIKMIKKWAEDRTDIEAIYLGY